VLVAPRLADDLDVMVVLRERIDERDDARGARERVAPLLKANGARPLSHARVRREARGRSIMRTVLAGI
jgi:hypothetical protein